MKATFLYNILLSIIVVTPVYTMERHIIALHKPLTHQPVYEENTHLSEYKQLNLSYDLLNKIFASCSHTERHIAGLTCKQFYCAAHINELHKFVCHDFVIGDKKEKAAFFKTFIEQNNPRLIQSLLKHARKEASDAVHIELGDPAQLKAEKEYRQQKHIQKNYLTPLLIEAIQQKNTTMIAQLSTENTDPTVLDSYYATIRYNKHQKLRTAAAICGIFVFIVISGAIGIGLAKLTCHNKWPGTICFFSCNGTPMSIRADSCHPTGCNMSCGGSEPIPIPCGLNCRENL